MYDDECSIVTQGTYHYLHHPRFEAYLVVLTTDEWEWCGHPKDAPWEKIDGWRWVSHNASFDTPIYEMLQEQGICPKNVNPAVWECTADLAAFLGVPRNLAGAAQHLLNEKVNKTTRNKMKGKRWNEMTPEFQKEVLDYTYIDGRKCLALWTRFGDQWPEQERRISQLTRKQAYRGLYVDVDRLDCGIQHMQTLLWAAEQKIPWAGTNKILSPEALAAECRKVGIEPPPDLAMTSEDCAAWEDKYGAKYPWVAAMRTRRRVNALLKKFQVIRSLRRPDGRVEYALKYFGAHTGRWSGGKGDTNSQSARKSEEIVGSDWNAQNLPQGEMFGAKWWFGRDPDDIRVWEKWVAGGRKKADVPKKDKGGRAWVTKDWDKWEKEGRVGEGKRLLGDMLNFDGQLDFGADLRKCFIAAPGKHFVAPDLSQIEPRVLWWFMGDVKALELVATGMSPYEAHARTTMGYVLAESLKKANPPLYRLAKARVLALGYACGWLKFITMVGMYLEPEEAEELWKMPVTDKQKDDFREYLDFCKRPEWIKMWETADAAERAKFVNSWLIVMAFRRSNPSLAGKRTPVGLWERLHQALITSINEGKDLEVELPSGRVMRYRKPARVEGELTGIIMRRGRPMRSKLYGGLLTENLVQATARDVFAEGMLRLEDAGHPVVVHIHDEAVCEVDVDVQPATVREVFAQPPSWMPDLPVASEAEALPYYTK